MYNMRGTFNMDENTKRKLPLLNAHETWLELYGETANDEIIKKKKELEKLQEGERETKRQLSDLNSKKKESLQEILKLSDQLNNATGYVDVKALDRAKSALERINFELDNVRYEAEEYPKKIRQANFELLGETVKYSVEEMTKRDEDNAEINAEMVEIREKLKELFERRMANDAWNEKIYVFLHSALGPNLIEKMDSIDIDEGEENENGN